MARRARPLRCWEPGRDQTPLPSWGCSVNSSPLGCGRGWAGAASPLQLFPCGSPIPAAQTASRGQPPGSFQQRYAALGHIRLCAGSSFFHSLLVPESFQDLCPHSTGKSVAFSLTAVGWIRVSPGPSLSLLGHLGSFRHWY